MYATFEAALAEQDGLANVADVDDVALLKEIAATAGGHKLHLAAPMLAGSEVGEQLHVVDVPAAVKVGDAVRGGVTVMVGPSGERRASQCEARARSGAKELATRGERSCTLRIDVATAGGYRVSLPLVLAGRH